jgi:hypothetical protein
MHVTGLDVNRVEIMLLHRVVLLCTLLISVVSNLLLAEASECPYIVFSYANLSWIAIPSSSSSTKVEASNNLIMDLRSRYSVHPLVTYAY